MQVVPGQTSIGSRVRLQQQGLDLRKWEKEEVLAAANSAPQSGRLLQARLSLAQPSQPTLRHAGEPAWEPYGLHSAARLLASEIGDAC